MSERPPESESVLETYIVDGRSLADWHRFLTTNKKTGEPEGDMRTPRSKFGSTADKCAWWAVAAHSCYTYFQGAVGEEYVAEESMELFMDLAVKNHWTRVHIVWEFRGVLPTELLDQLCWDWAHDR